MLTSLLAGLALVAMQDTVRTVLAPPPTFTLAEFTTQVRQLHPVVRQAALIERAAAGELLSARAEIWDPKLSVDYDRKTFGGTQYYDYVVAGIKIPTPLGIDFKLGYERTQGTYFSQDRRTPSSGLLVAGVSVPLARGIITDARRTAVAQAKALQDAAVAERAAAINKLVYGSVKDFSYWYEADRKRALAEEGVGLARFRLDAIRRRLMQGDAAPIDTIEAVLELERRQVVQLESRAQAFAAAQAAAVYLWGSDGAPVDLVAGTVPSLGAIAAARLDTTEAGAWRQQALRQHPEVQKALAKLEQARAARLLATQGLLPEARLDLAALATRDSVGVFDGWPDVGQNYKIGFSASSSLLLMKERGKLTSTRAKAESAELDATLATRQVDVGIRVALNDVMMLEQLLDRQAAAVVAARQLRDGEVAKFENGESTLFVVNTRDRTVLDEAAKLASYEAKYAVTRAALAAALGEPGVYVPPP